MATDIDKLKERLSSAEDAYHEMMIGDKAVTIVDQNGERVEYARANSAKLAGYIAELKRQIAVCEGRTPPNGPIYVWGC